MVGRTGKHDQRCQRLTSNFFLHRPREDSRGAHFREDHPETGSLHDSTYIVIRQQDGQLQTSREPVRFTRVKPGQTIVAEEAAAAS